METRDRILEAYSEYLRSRGKPPTSVYRLCKRLEIDEKTFFDTFPSLEAVEGAYWADTISRVVERIEAGEEWSDYNARQRLLVFLFAYLEDAKAFRSILLARFKDLQPYENPNWLMRFRRRFEKFGRSILEHGLESGEIARRANFSAIYPAGMYLHFRSVISFYLTDDSQDFERTDAFVEKSVKLAFDAIAPQALDSAIDLARFFLPRKSS